MKKKSVKKKSGFYKYLEIGGFALIIIIELVGIYLLHRYGYLNAVMMTLISACIVIGIISIIFKYNDFAIKYQFWIALFVSVIVYSLHTWSSLNAELAINIVTGSAIGFFPVFSRLIDIVTIIYTTFMLCGIMSIIVLIITLIDARKLFINLIHGKHTHTSIFISLSIMTQLIAGLGFYLAFKLSISSLILEPNSAINKYIASKIHFNMSSSCSFKSKDLKTGYTYIDPDLTLKSTLEDTGKITFQLLSDSLDEVCK